MKSGKMSGWTCRIGWAGLALMCAAQIAMAASPGPATHPTTDPTRALYTWGDQGDGTYRNPILFSDFSDPDITRVGGDFYMVASDFSYVGMQVLHSKDMVNWKIIGQVFNRLTMDKKYDQMNGYAQGTWAPSIRYHNSEFYVYVCTPYDGLFMWHAKNPAGPWSDTVTVKAVPQWEDPCPFWDDDGQAYLIHSHKGAGPLIIHHMSTDGTQLLDDGTQVYTGNGSEGPKLYKRHGYYYVSFPEGGVANGWQTVIRAKSIFGPYESKRVMNPGNPHQGGIVELDSGESWFIGFKQQTGALAALGRVDYLEPVVWGSDDWPTFGNNGNDVGQFKKPNVGMNTDPEKPAVSDEFDATALNPIWQWNHNPVAEAWSLQDRPGYLRLSSLPADDIAQARNTITQKLWDNAGVIDVRLDATGLTNGEHAGVTFIIGHAFAWAGVTRDGGQLYWESSVPASNGRGATSTTSAQPIQRGFEASGSIVTLEARYEASRGTITALESPAQANSDRVNMVDGYRLGFADWKGSRFGIFTYGPTGGHVDVGWVHYVYGANVADLTSR
jgi:beta-xylosidase